MNIYLPEGFLINNERNQYYISGEEGLAEAMKTGAVIEAYCTMCGANRDLTVSSAGIKGKILRKNAAPENAKDISLITCVGRPVSFRVIGKNDEGYIFSRTAAMNEAMEQLLSPEMTGKIIDARVTHLASFGIFVDIGCGNISMIGIENISVSRITHPRDRFRIGQNIKVLITGADRINGRVLLSHKELLGTWQQNAAGFSAGQTVRGVVRGVEKYGVFVELTPNLSGLAEPTPGIKPGMGVSVFIKSIIPEKHKIKLSVISILEDHRADLLSEKDYHLSGDSIVNWQYF